MKKIILILAVIPMMTLGQVYTYEDYNDIYKLREELREYGNDIMSVQKMNYIDGTTKQGAVNLMNNGIFCIYLLDHASNLIYVYTLLNNAGDKIKVGAFIKKEIGTIREKLERQKGAVTETLFFIDNTYLVTCGDKLKGSIKKAIRKLKSLELRTE